MHTEQPKGDYQTKAMTPKQPTSRPVRGLSRRGMRVALQAQVEANHSLRVHDFQAAAPAAARLSNPIVAGAAPLHRSSSSTPSFRPNLQIIAGGEQFATGANRIKAEVDRNQSDIVLVTALGNVTSSHQLIPRG